MLLKQFPAALPAQSRHAFRAKFLIQRHQIGNIYMPMQRRKAGYKLAAREGKGQMVDIE